MFYFRNPLGQALQVEAFVSYSAPILQVENEMNWNSPVRLISYKNQNHKCLDTLMSQSGLQALKGRLCNWRPWIEIHLKLVYRPFSATLPAF